MVKTTTAVPRTEAGVTKSRLWVRPVRVIAVLAAMVAIPYAALAAWCGSPKLANRFLAGERLFVESESDTIRTDGQHPTLIRRYVIRNTGFDRVKIVGCTSS